MGWGNVTSFQPYGRKLVDQRKRLNQFLYKKTIEEYHPEQTREAYKLLMNLLSKPGGCKQAFFLFVPARLYFSTCFLTEDSRYAAATIVKVDYGHDLLDEKDDYFQLALRARHSINHSGPVGNTALDFFPFRKVAIAPAGICLTMMISALLSEVVSRNLLCGVRSQHAP
jgi:hypothetical protein